MVCKKVRFRGQAFRRRLLWLSKAGLLAAALASLEYAGYGQPPPTHDPVQYGPYNGTFLADGLGLKRAIANTHDSVLGADAPWTMLCWLRTSEPVTARELVAGVGETSSEYPRYLAVDAGRVTLWMGKDNQLSAPAALAPNAWHLIAATFDGARFTLYSEGKVAGGGTLVLGSAGPLLQLAPPVVVKEAGRHFGGEVAGFSLLRRPLAEAEVAQLARTPPDFATMLFERGSKPWPFQTRGQAGYRAPQDPATLPVSRAPFAAPVAIKRPPLGASLQATGEGEWTFGDGWRLREAPKVEGDGAAISTAAYAASGWMRATVPGTVLTTMVDDGIYPDPDYGLNNLAIPESLNRQNYWYRNEFVAPAASSGRGRHTELNFEGINYEAVVWLNGKRLGSIKGAFTRGTFDVTSILLPGAKNVLAVRISPPPHPGIPQEQSILGGPGENGGSMALDGPTFVATEGWDWIPAIRDRNSGIWQPVTLKVTQALKLGDVQVLTSFPNHDPARAALEITVPVINTSGAPVQATISASVEQLSISRQVTLPPGESVVELKPAEYAQLMVDRPRLWWPNGYGSPELYRLKVAVKEDSAAAASDAKEVRFGIREISYELSLMDASGHLRRVEYFPTLDRASPRGAVDVSHEGMIEIPSADAAALDIAEERRDRYPYQSHVASIAAGADKSASLRAIADGGPAPYLVIKVNGVRIAARGGNWGMDDSRKRVSRAHLEPFFRLDRDANLNIIRNWVGQNTEEVFYDLADEYGMLVWNDFWESTQNYNAEAEDPALFLANAADTIKRFRNHPSIVLWCGRNEGVPQPIINEGLAALTRTLDGTRYYSPSSNQVNLQDSGPYSYQDPALYFRQLNRGFSVETGTPSMSTLESFRSSVPKADQWPIDDVWAYHDWHQSGNGDVHTFMAEIEAEFGAPTGLEDFERKAQMLNYVDHRAIFEGMNANLWTPNSGRMLWMTQPAWPSNHWQILSSDYDTQASFYGVKKACEPVHIQLNLATHGVDVINTTRADQGGLAVSVKVYSLANALLFAGAEKKDVAANSRVASLHLDLGSALANGMVIVQLELHDAAGKLLSQNLYWLGRKAADYRELNRLASTPVTMRATSRSDGTTVHLHVELTNTGAVASLANKLTLLSARTKLRALPAYYSDNYISLLPGQTQAIDIETPADALDGSPEIALRGWNTIPKLVVVK